MAEIALNTATPKVGNRTYGFGASHIDGVALAAHTTAAYEYIAAPVAGVLKTVTFQAGVTSDATKTYALAITNENNSGASMCAVTYDADPVATADTPLEAALSGTAANLVVAKGDVIKIGGAGGSGSGTWGVVLEWELA